MSQIEDACEVCGKESEVGVIGQKEGKATHEHYCEGCWYHIKRGKDIRGRLATSRERILRVQQQRGTAE